MIIVSITDGLGNQMFQYSYGRCLAFLNKKKLKLDITYYDNILEGHTPRKFSLDCFNINCEIATNHEINLFNGVTNNMLYNMLYKIKKNCSNNSFINKALFKIAKETLPYQTIFQTETNSSNITFKVNKNIYLKGFWQSEMFFSPIKDIIKFEFQFKSSLINLFNSKNISDITNSNSIAIHIRRGDYISNPIFARRYGICSLEYYLNAFEYMNKQINNPEFFIFSDDLDWAKNHLNIQNIKIQFIEGNSELEDLYLMSKCKHQIIANSSFSWWAAWLNSNTEKIVVAPEKWFNIKENYIDVIPSTWIKI